MPVETPRSNIALKQWTSPLIASLRGEDALSLQKTFSSLTDFLNGMVDTIGSNYYSLSIGSVSSGLTASASVTGSFPNQTLNLSLPTGGSGPVGPAGPSGPAGSSGYALADLDGGAPDSVYGGTPTINAGGV